MAHPIEFPERNRVWAKDQPEYLPLPAYTDEHETITKWRLTWGERIKVLLTGHIWLRQSNFRQPLQPQRLQIEYPFIPIPHKDV